MATDGEIDFRIYTREQLDSAIGRMDRGRYPINYRNLSAEYQRRRVAERQAAELAAQSGTAVPPDNMLSVPRRFAVTFEPQAGPNKSFGPSRNAFHLVASGSIQVDGPIVRVTGRRFGIFLGLPLMRTEELGRQFVVNVEFQGAVFRFELRVPGEKVRALTLWLPSAVDAQELSKSLPIERTPDFIPQLGRHVEFERSLIAQSPKTPVTHGLVIICVCVYLATAVATDHLFGFDGQSLLPLGSNCGPFTTDGDWWRLLTSMFLHAGLIHLAFNMWALASFGPVVERLYGSVSYALVYFVAGAAGSLASVTWNPAVNSIGASGAIFGILGALIAAQMRGDGSIPKSVLQPFRNSSLVFAGCALFAGLLSNGVDNADHLGGIAMGFIMGLVLSRPITGLALSTRDFIRRLSFAAAMGVLFLGTGVAAAKYASARLTGEAQFAATVHWFQPGEDGALQRWHKLGVLSKADKWDDTIYANRIEREVIPFWKEADSRWAKLDLPLTSPAYDSLELIRSVAKDRLYAYQLTVKGLRQHDASIAENAMLELQRVDDRVKEQNKAGSPKPGL
jgi:rhomboid protease GluP